MTPKLTDDQRQAIQEHGGSPVYLVDSITNETYVLMRANQYERVKGLFEAEGEYDPRDAYPFIERVMQEDDANDPALESYQTIPGQQP